MRKELITIAALLAATAVLLVGHGLQLTLLPLRAAAFGWPTELIGYTGSTYFAGFIAGCFVVPRLVGRVGHTRVFMVLTAIATSALLGVSLFDYFPAWLALRFATGVAISGLYLVIEGWLNEQATPETRGAILSIYTTIVLLAMIGGQLLVSIAAPDGYQIIVIATFFLCLAAVPVGLSRAPTPTIAAAATFRPRHIFETSHVATGGSFLVGLVAGTFFAIGPVYGNALGHEIDVVTMMMAAAVLGGAAFQIPFGRLSDRVDRRVVIILAFVIGTAICLVGWTLDMTNSILAVSAFFVLGGSILTVYPLCLAHANDNVNEGFLEIGTGILVMNSAGSVIGPLVCAPLMTQVGPSAFFGFGAVALGAGAIWSQFWRMRRTAPKPFFAPFVSATPMSQGAIELDPRADHAAETTEEKPIESNTESKRS